MATIYSSGFGDAHSNDTWTDDGTYLGQPRWVNSTADRWIRSSGGGTPRWYIATTNTGVGTGSIYYDNNDITTDPFPYSAGVSWVNNGGGTPLGTVTQNITYTLTAAQGSYTLTGQALGLTKSLTLGIAQGSYSLTGIDAAIGRLTTIALAQGSYSLSGQDASFTKALNMLLAQGSYALTGEDLGLNKSLTMQLDYGIYVLAGQPVSFLFRGWSSPTTPTATWTSPTSPAAVSWTSPDNPRT